MNTFSHSDKGIQHAHGLVVPLNADTVEAPIIHYGGGTTAINFMTDDERWGRVTFERLDSIKVSRGEYNPFPSAPGEEESFFWVTTISNSLWLRERYEYEKRYIARILKAVKWNKYQAAKQLGITRSTLYSKIEKYQLKPGKSEKRGV